jgi:hypothetical protein|tara:strand:- start:196 stop:801 length:606 start_codon:yes stop_codon:yes gene_type:complete
MRVAWINGWSLEEGPLRALVTKRFPKDEHVVIASIPGWDRVLENVEGIEVLIGYSLGAFLLMSRPDLCGGAKRTILLAPFEDLRSKSERGGRVRRGQLSYLLKWLDRDAVAAVVDFRKRSGISELMSEAFNFSVDQLKWGIEVLMTEMITPGAIESFECYLGSEDALLDAAYFDNAYPSINIVEGAGHDLEGLLERGLTEL